MANSGRPPSRNVDYFPHYCKDDKKLQFIQIEYGSEGYEAFYRIQQALGDADYHRIDLKNDLEKKMFEMTMRVKQECIYGTLEILAKLGWLDKNAYEIDSILWSDEFVKSIRPVYVNRRQPVPTIDSPSTVSTCRNESIVEEIKEQQSKEKNREEDESPISFQEFSKKYPNVDIEKSARKLFSYIDKPTFEKADSWFKEDQENGRNLKKVQFEKTPSGDFKAYCSKCGDKMFPKNKFQLKEGSTCCRAEYQPKKKRKPN